MTPHLLVISLHPFEPSVTTSQLIHPSVYSKTQASDTGEHCTCQNLVSCELGDVPLSSPSTQQQPHEI